MRIVLVLAVLVMTVVLWWMIWVNPGWLYQGTDDWRNGFLTGAVCAMLSYITFGFFQGFFGAMWRDLRGRRDDHRTG